MQQVLRYVMSGVLGILMAGKLSSSSGNQMNYENKSRRKITTRRVDNLQAQPIIWGGVYELDGGHIGEDTL